jgi:trehalose synthase
MKMKGPFIRQTEPFDLPALERIVPAESMQSLKLLARQVQFDFHQHSRPVKIWHINSSAVGGGVADILNYLVPLSNEMGILSHWFVIDGDPAFFEITKTFHNALQGSVTAAIEPEMFTHFEAVVKRNGECLQSLVQDYGIDAPDVIVIHDPQPSALVPFLRQKFSESILIWRGHIQFDFQSHDYSHPGRRIWEFLLNYINACDCAIFHLPEMVPPGINIPIRFILPSINPLAYINRDLNSPHGTPFIDSTLHKYKLERFHDRSVPMLLQNARFDPWKDPSGVIEAVRSARKSLSNNGHSPELVLAGPLAEDDPEAKTILAQLSQLLDGDGAVHLIPIDPKNRQMTTPQSQALQSMGLDPGNLTAENVMELEINALQTRADIIIAKSLREGFGLAVTGAGFHGKPRIVSQVGGLAHQVASLNGHLLAALVGGAPQFSRQVSIEMTRDWIVKLLTTPDLRNSMGNNAKQHVIENFLPHRHLSDYLNLFLELRKAKQATTQAVAPA